jgi:fatty acid desaturase
MQYYHAIGPIIALPLLIVICALHGSMCHELIHSHPTRITWINTLLGSVPLTLFLPYPIYRESHLEHHHDESITLPGKDPESYYCSATAYQNKSGLAKAFAWVNMTIAGRLLFNPSVEFSGWVNRHLKHSNRATWWQYLLVAYFANWLTRIRSFYEHRARTAVSERTVLMEPRLFFRLLFLNLNFHLAHHENPSIPWYQLGDYYRAHRSDLITRSGDFFYSGYRHWLLGHLFRPVDSPIHPFTKG